MSRSAILIARLLSWLFDGSLPADRVGITIDRGSKLAEPSQRWPEQ